MLFEYPVFCQITGGVHLPVEDIAKCKGLQVLPKALVFTDRLLWDAHRRELIRRSASSESLESPSLVLNSLGWAVHSFFVSLQTEWKLPVYLANRVYEHSLCSLKKSLLTDQCFLKSGVHATGGMQITGCTQSCAFNLSSSVVLF